MAAQDPADHLRITCGSPADHLGRIFWVAERVQREIWTEIDTLYAPNGHNLPLLISHVLQQ